MLHPNAPQLVVAANPDATVAHIQRIVGTIRIGVDDAVRLDLTGNDGHQRLGFGVVLDACGSSKRASKPLA